MSGDPTLAKLMAGHPVGVGWPARHELPRNVLRAKRASASAGRKGGLGYEGGHLLIRHPRRQLVLSGNVAAQL